jgi:hypothetical protein
VTANLPPLQTVPELVDGAIMMGKRWFWPLLRLGLVPFIATAALFYVAQSDTSLFVRYTATLGCYASAGLLDAAMVAGAWQLIHGQAADPSVVWAILQRRAGSIALANALKGVIELAGFILLVVPGVYILALWFAVPGAIAIENVGVREAFARSQELARGSMKRIFSSIGLFWVAVLAVAIVLPLAMAGVGIPENSNLTRIVASLWWFPIEPFRMSLTALVYLDLRMRKEGYDLQRGLSLLPAPT